MSIRVDKPQVHFSISNTSGSNLTLSTIAFDFASVNGNSPRNLKVIYTSGGLTIPNETILLNRTSILNGLGKVSNYEDVSIDLSTLADHTLAPGQSAQFRFEVDTANINNQALALDNIAILGSSPDFRIVTYNIHGGEGPGDEGDLVTNLTAFRDNFLQGEDVLCFQEVDVGNNWTTLKSLFPDYPYTFQTVNTTTAPIFFWQSRKQTSCAILSKHPFVTTDSRLIQIDPAVDKWERHAQYVQIQLGSSLVNIFHYHNTYNFGYREGNTPSSEREGLEKFRDYVEDRMGITSYTEGKNLIMLGDYNLFQNSVHRDVVPILSTPTRRTNNRDHITATPLNQTGGNYLTVAPKLSDHNAVWATFDLQPPTTNAVLWEVAPTMVDTTSITMTTARAEDASEVEYYFANISVPDKSHDSGWQESPTFNDTGLTAATEYRYTVRFRDKSKNQNETASSAPASALTDDGDELPNEWELSYFPNLQTTTGTLTEDWDQDGFSDLSEWIAGTDPTNASSLLTARIEQLDDGQMRISWDSVLGKLYRVMTSTSLSGTWLQVGSTVLADSLESSLDLALSLDPISFYRVEVGF